MPRYVALGSSFASGPGVDPVLDAGCGRSARNYAQLTAQRLGLDLLDASCGGATVANVVSAAQLLLDGSSVPPQLDAVDAAADLVTVTAGGNDVEYLLTLLRCSYRVAPEAAPRASRAFFGLPVDRAAVSRALDGLPASLAGMVDAVRDRAPRARVVLVDYLTVLPGTGGGCAALAMADDDLAFCRDLARRLEAATARAAEESGAELLAASALSRDHSVCAAEPWVTGWEFGDVLAGGAAPYHPNAAGMRAVADALVDHLRR
ncbi:SGNH/GDSL hydrolase family protein [Geodermatophilus sp. CPCC 205761]|uniref:SGNH/GDSL hydrolase family protein n=1 Tax=Geodermatophilus sp. CPCC 205761 TaxID=2936597 RepID=UPI003EEAA415